MPEEECQHYWVFKTSERKLNPWGYYYTLVTYYCSRCLTIKEREEK